MMYARKIGVQRIDFFPDMIWLLPVPILSDALPGSARKEAVLSFRHDVRTDCKPEGYVSCLLTILDQLVDYLIRDAGFTVRIAYQVDEDQSFSLFLWERYRNQYEFLSSPEPITQKTIGEVYSAAGLVFSNRLHVLLLGVLHGCIPFAVIDADEQQKISGMFNDMLLNHLIVDVRHDTFNGEYIQDVLRDYAILQERISKYAILCRRKARSVLQHLFERSD
jgi:polysaccharide pyruvyl transferase WcaK-like protein